MLARSPYPSIVAMVYLALALLAPLPGLALQTFDFEARYLVHEGQQIWDFCLKIHEDRYHVFYHTIPPNVEHPSAGDTIWHAVSDDLRRWDNLGPAITSGPDWWDAEAVWAPDVVYDEASERWAMLYTGVSTGMVQRACLAWSEDLITWTKAPENPVFEPDPMTYYWAPDQDWSSFRDPFIYFENGQWNMLNTAGLRLGEYPGYKRAIVHRATSPDLVSWTDAGVFFEHDGETGQWYDFESVQYIKRGSYHHLFFVEQDPTVATHSTSILTASDRSGWTMADREFLDEGWAPEVERVGGWFFDTMFGRLHQYDDPSTGDTNIVIRFDSMTFGWFGNTPAVHFWDPLYRSWPTRAGEVGVAAPTFDDNPILRGEVSSRQEGHGWFSSYEYYGGPLSEVGEPGAVLGDEAQGGLTSREFHVAGSYMRFLLAGGDYPETCYLAMIDSDTGEILRKSSGNGMPFMTEHIWDIEDLQGRSVKLHIVDHESGPGGWIAVDSIQETHEDLSPVEADTPEALQVARVYPNPFNPQTTVAFRLGAPAQLEIMVHDVAGRQVRRLASGLFAGGSHQVEWNGQDDAGRGLPSGTYFIRLTDGLIDESHKVLLVK